MDDSAKNNARLIEQFYTSFAKRDYAAMAACYDARVEFSDPVFALSGVEARAMWHMLCESGRDLSITFRDVWADAASGRAHWEATYTFSSTGRKVHNILDAEFQFSNGAIILHRDHFDFWRWSSQALGPAGLFLGWTPLIRGRVRSTAARNLSKFIANHPEYQSKPS